VDTFLIFLLVGFLAQIVDGAIGMAFGVIANTVLLALGLPPATASASVHVAKIFTGAASAVSHVAHRNVLWPMFWPLMLAGVAGGVAGALALTAVDGETVKPFILAYLALMGVYVLWRGLRRIRQRPMKPAFAAPLGAVGGFLDAVGGGGWGPTVTSTLVGTGADPRCAIGTVNSAEFFVTAAISGAFAAALLTGRWSGLDLLGEHLAMVLGLIAGGLVAAPFAGWVTKHAPQRLLTLAVGGLLVLLAGIQGLEIAGVFGAQAG